MKISFEALPILIEIYIPIGEGLRQALLGKVNR